MGEVTKSIFKFKIPDWEVRPVPGTAFAYSGCLAIVIADSVEEARELVRKHKPGEFDSGWIDVASVEVFKLEASVVVGTAMI